MRPVQEVLPYGLRQSPPSCEAQPRIRVDMRPLFAQARGRSRQPRGNPPIDTCCSAEAAEDKCTRAERPRAASEGSRAGREGGEPRDQALQDVAVSVLWVRMRSGDAKRIVLTVGCSQTAHRCGRHAWSVHPSRQQLPLREALILVYQTPTTLSSHGRQPVLARNTKPMSRSRQAQRVPTLSPVGTTAWKGTVADAPQIWKRGEETRQLKSSAWPTKCDRKKVRGDLPLWADSQNVDACLFTQSALVSNVII